MRTTLRNLALVAFAGAVSFIGYGVLAPATARAEAPTNQYALIRAYASTPISRGVITATTTKNNHDTAVSFLNTGRGVGNRFLGLQCSAACRVTFGTANTVTATQTAASIYLEANVLYPFIMSETYGWIAMVPASGSTSTDLGVFEYIL